MTDDLQQLADGVVSRTLVDQRAKQTPVADPSPWCKHWRTWLRKMLPKYFKYEFSARHAEFWEWAWNVRPGIKPDPVIFCLNRKGGKSQSIEGAAAMWGAFRLRKYILYFSGTQTQSDGHVLTVQEMLKSPGIKKYYPMLSEAKVNDYGTRSSWSRKRLWTRHGFIIDSLGLNVAIRGAKLMELRPDAIFIDDIDDKHDTIIGVLKKLEILSADILPSGSDDSAVAFAQNLIHADSVCSQIKDHRAGILRNRIFIGPVAALDNFEYETKPGRKPGDPEIFVLPEGPNINIPTWVGMDRKKAEANLNESGLVEFLREYQQDTSVTLEGMIYGHYSELHHIVTRSEVMRAFRRHKVSVCDEHNEFMVPRHWKKALGHDVGYSPEHPSAFGWVTKPPQFEPYTDIMMWYRERVRPKYPHRKGSPVDPVSPMGNVKLIRDCEEAWEEDIEMEVRIMSHEQSSQQAAYNVDEKIFSQEYEGLGFTKVRPDRRGGISIMQNMYLIDYSRPHPFRRYPAGYILDGKDLSGQPVMGRPRMVDIVQDDQGELYLDDEGKLCIRQPVDEEGHIRYRHEIVKYVNPRNASGIELNAPPAIFNDVMDARRFLATKWFVSAAEPTRDQRREMETTPHLKMKSIMEAPECDRPSLMATRILEQRLWEYDNPEDVLASPVMRVRQKRKQVREKTFHD